MIKFRILVIGLTLYIFFKCEKIAINLELQIVWGHRSNNKDSCSKSNVGPPKPVCFNVSNAFDTTKFTFNLLGLHFIVK